MNSDFHRNTYPLEGPRHNTDKARLGTRKQLGSNLAGCITQSGLLGEQRKQNRWGEGWGAGFERGCSLPCGAQEPVEKSAAQGPPARSAPPRLLAASQLSPRIWLAPSTRLCICSQSAQGAAGGEGLRVTCGRAEPSAPPACPLARRPRSLRPFPHARCPASDSAGHRRARPVATRARWGRRHSQATTPRRSPARPSTCTSASRSVRPPSPRVPRTAEVGIGTTQREIGPRPSCSQRRAWPRGGRVSSRLCPAHDK
ncbi:hypothetical protein H8959_008147, partial [Pygathrix nigripes]